jgi:hypothetical protein
MDGKNFQQLAFNHNLWESFEIRIHAGLRNYLINGIDVNPEFATPIHIDSVTISQANIEFELESENAVGSIGGLVTIMFRKHFRLKRIWTCLLAIHCQNLWKLVQQSEFR